MFRWSAILPAWITLALASAVGLILALPPRYPDAGINYLLASLAQVLAAILGFAFIVSLAVMQSITVQTSRALFTNRRFWLVTVSYAFLYVAVLLATLILLKNPNSTATDVLLSLASLSLLLLPAYFLFLVRELTPSRIYSHLRASITTSSAPLGSKLNSIGAIHNIGMSAYHRGDYDSVDLAADSLLTIANSVGSKAQPFEFLRLPYKTKWLLIGGHTEPALVYSPRAMERMSLEVFRRILHMVTVPQNDPYIPLLLMSKINRWGNSNTKDYNLLDQLLIAEAVIALLMAERLVLDTVWWVFDFFRSIQTDLFDIHSRNAALPDYIMADYLTSVASLIAAAKTHCPRFAPALESLLDIVVAKVSPEVASEASKQSESFLNDVFPDLLA